MYHPARRPWEDELPPRLWRACACSGWHKVARLLQRYLSVKGGKGAFTVLSPWYEGPLCAPGVQEELHT